MAMAAEATVVTVATAETDSQNFMHLKSRFHSVLGGSLVEVMVSVAITVIAISAIYVGSITLQKSFRAAQHYTTTQAAQLRVIDYVAMDLRRAVGYPSAATSASTVGLPSGAVPELELLIPNYYDISDPDKPKPRVPKIGPNGEIYYGTSASDLVKISYFTVKSTGSSGQNLCDVYRAVTANGVVKTTQLVSGAEDFTLTFAADDPKQQLVSTKITFPPMFRPLVGTGNIYKDGTATYATTLVRNKR